MSHEIRSDPISGLWTSEAWSEASVELQDCFVQTIELRLADQYAVEIQILDGEGLTWIVGFDGVERFVATTLDERASDRPAIAAGQIGSSFCSGDQFQLDHIDGSISFHAKSSTVRSELE